MILWRFLATLFCALLALGAARGGEPDPVQVRCDSQGAGLTSTVRRDGSEVRTFIGQLTMHLNGGPKFNVAGDAFPTFSVDPEHEVRPGMAYLVQRRSTGDGLRHGAAIAYLYHSYGQRKLTDADRAAGLQLAIWKLALDRDGKLDAGRFQYRHDDRAADWARHYLARAASNTGVGGWLDGEPGGKAGVRGQSVLIPLRGGSSWGAGVGDPPTGQSDATTTAGASAGHDAGSGESNSDSPAASGGGAGGGSKSKTPGTASEAGHGGPDDPTASAPVDPFDLPRDATGRSITAQPPSAPEIDAGSLGGALTLLLGGALVLADRLRRRT